MARWLLIVGLFAAWLNTPTVRAADHAEAEVEGSVEHGAASKPDLPLKFQGDLALWSAITFLFFFFVLSKLAWKPLIEGMNAREGKIRQDIADAESNRLKSETLLKDYETRLAKVHDEVKAILAEARKDADHAKQDILATADKESAAMRQRAVGDIERARDQALGELFDFVSKNVVQATEQVVGRSLTGSDQDRLVKEALASLDLRKN
jgi:F-type H+-transporting ATPase subunit b